MSESREGASLDEGLPGWVSAHDKAASDKSLCGLSLVVRTVVAFLVPAVTALIGAVVIGGGEVKRFAGLIAGLALGILIAKLGSFFMDRVIAAEAPTPAGMPDDPTRPL